MWGAKDHHYVRATINGWIARGALNDAGGQHFLSLGAVWLRDNTLDVGAEVEVEIFPEGPQMENLAADIAAALAGEPQAIDFFNGLATFYRKNFIRWIESAKRPETRQNRIQEMIALLKAGKREK